MAPEMSLEDQRPAEYMSARHVETMMASIQEKRVGSLHGQASTQRPLIGAIARLTARNPMEMRSIMLTSVIVRIIDFCLRHALSS